MKTLKPGAPHPEIAGGQRLRGRNCIRALTAGTLTVLFVPVVAADCLNATFVAPVDSPNGGPAPYDVQVWFDCTTNGPGHSYRAVVSGPEDDEWQGSDCQDSHWFTLRKAGTYTITLYCDGAYERAQTFTVTGSGGGGAAGSDSGFDPTILAFLIPIGLSLVVGGVMAALKSSRALQKQAPAAPRQVWGQPPPPQAPTWTPAPREPPTWQRDEEPRQPQQAALNVRADVTVACPRQWVTITVECSEPIASVTWACDQHAGTVGGQGNHLSFRVRCPEPASHQPTMTAVRVDCTTVSGNLCTSGTALVKVRALSGRHWVGVFPYDDNPATALAPPFREGFLAFKAALDQAGATCKVNSAYRDPRRQYLMWGSGVTARGLRDGSGTEADPRGNEGVDICWCHRDASGQPNPALAKVAATEMAKDFGILPWGASRFGNHPRRLAVDMTVRWNGVLQWPSGYTIASTPRDETNPDLHRMALQFGVVHFVPKMDPKRGLLTDNVHWSVDGR